MLVRMHKMKTKRGSRYFWAVIGNINNEIWVCGNCKEPFTFYDTNPSEAGWHFCPCCGHPKLYYETFEEGE